MVTNKYITKIISALPGLSLSDSHQDIYSPL